MLRKYKNLSTIFFFIKIVRVFWIFEPKLCQRFSWLGVYGSVGPLNGLHL